MARTATGRNPRHLKTPTLGNLGLTIPSLDQVGFRGRNDDGNETTATWKAAENTPWTQVVDTNLRVRFVLDELNGGDPASCQYILQYNLNGAGWVRVDGASIVVRASLSPNMVDGEVTTRQLSSGSGSFVSGGFDEGDGGRIVDINSTEVSELEFCVQVRSADVVASDSIQLRVSRELAYGALPLYSQIATLTVGGAQIIAVTMATETDSARNVIGGPLRKALETDTSQALGRAKTKLVTLASETDTAQAVGKSKTKAIILATETDAARLLIPSPRRVLETDSAQALGKAKTRLIGIASETDAARTVTTPPKVNRVQETDTAQALTRLKSRAITLAAETDASQTITRSKRKAITLATEADASQALTRAKSKVVAVATETDAAQTITRRKTKLVGLVTETDTSRPVTRAGGVGAALETDTAQAIGKSKSKAVTLASEADSGIAVTRRKTLAVGIAAETDSAQVIGKAKLKLISVSAETDVSITITRHKSRVPGVVNETDLARTILLRPHIIRAEETDTALSILVLLAGVAIEFPASYEPTIGLTGSSGEEPDFVGSQEPLVVLT